MMIYRVKELKNLETKETFFKDEDTAKMFMKKQAQYWINRRDDLFISCDAPKYLSIRIGNPDTDDSGLFIAFEMDEIIVY